MTITVSLSELCLDYQQTETLLRKSMSTQAKSSNFKMAIWARTFLIICGKGFRKALHCYHKHRNVQVGRQTDIRIKVSSFAPFFGHQHLTIKQNSMSMLSWKVS